MNRDETKREKPDFFEDMTTEVLEAQPRSSFDHSKEKKAPPPKLGPHWEVDDSPPSDFARDFFKPA